MAVGRRRREGVLDEPAPPFPTHVSRGEYPAVDEHLVCRLEDPLQVGRIALREGELLGELFERKAPAGLASGSRHRQETAESSGDWR